MTEPIIFTIGHSDHKPGKFVDLLKNNYISAVADVRSAPYSRYHPQFDRNEIEKTLKEAGIGYVFLGEELGARRTEVECYVDGKARYELIARTHAFQNGLRRLKKGCLTHRIALMCAERDPLTCHRAILIGRYLRASSVSISHILDDGKLETNYELECRLLKSINMDGGDLLDSRTNAIEKAYEIQGLRIAYQKTASKERTSK